MAASGDIYGRYSMGQGAAGPLWVEPRDAMHPTSCRTPPLIVTQPGMASAALENPVLPVGGKMHSQQQLNKTDSSSVES